MLEKSFCEVILNKIRRYKAKMDLNDKTSVVDVLTTNNLNPIEKVRLLKKLSGKSFNEIAKGCDCSKAQIVLIFQDKYYPSSEIKQKIAEFFGVNTLELWRDE